MLGQHNLFSNGTETTAVQALVDEKVFQCRTLDAEYAQRAKAKKRKAEQEKEVQRKKQCSDRSPHLAEFLGSLRTAQVWFICPIPPPTLPSSMATR
jgi:hypothetical protein